MREHTEKELRKKLSDKGYQKAEIDEAVGKLITVCRRNALLRLIFVPDSERAPKVRRCSV